MIPQTKPHIEIISQFAELILHNRITSSNYSQMNPNHFNLSFQNSYHNVYQKLNEATSKASKLNTIGVEISFFLQNQEAKHIKQLVESWVINVHIPNQTIEIMTPRKQLSFDNQKSHKLCIIQSRGISSFLVNTPLYQKFININPQNNQELKKLLSQNTLLHQLRLCLPELEINKIQTQTFNQHIFPPINILCAAGVKGQLQIKVKYLNNIEKLQFNEQNFTCEEIVRPTSINALETTSPPGTNYQNALTQESSNHTNNSSDKKEYEFAELKHWRKGSMQPDLPSKQRSRTKSFSTQIAAYSKKDDVVLLTTAENAIEFDLRSDEEFDFQMIQEEKLDPKERIKLNDDWQMMDFSNEVYKSKDSYKTTDLWKLLEGKKKIFQKNTKHQQKLMKSQLLITILFVKEQ